MDEKREELRELLRSFRESNKCYPRWLRDRAGRYALQRREEGAKWATLGEELVVSSGALSGWMRMVRFAPADASERGSKSSAKVKEEESQLRPRVESELGEIRHQLQKAQEERHYPPALRSRVRCYALSRRQAGKSWSAISKELGIGKTTVRRWVSQGQEVFVPVLVEEAPPRAVTTSLHLISPAGYRVEGLSLPQVAELLRELP